jgi:hypothetical protein
MNTYVQLCRRTYSRLRSLVHNIGNLLLWDDAVVVQGFWNDASSGIMVGQWTKNEIRRACFTQVLSLMVGTLLSAACYDRSGQNYLFVHESRIKPSLRSAKSGERMIRTGVHWSTAIVGVWSCVPLCTPVWRAFLDLGQQCPAGDARPVP